MTKFVRWLSAAIAFVSVAEPAQAHGIVGNRFFPGTMTFDDPAIADEFTILPSFWKHPLNSQSGFNIVDKSMSWSFVRLLTPELSLGVDSGWIHRSGFGFPTQTGFDQTSITLKQLMYKNEPHEILISASFTWGIASTGSQAVGANSPNTLVPAITFGKGFGDLPDQLGWLRPFGITGAIAAEFPTRATSVNFGFDPATTTFGPVIGTDVTTLHWGLSLQYSTFYLTDRFKSGQLPEQEPLHQFIPLVEFAFDSPRTQKTAATMNPGLAYVEDVWQLSAVAIVPLNSQGGHGLGFRAQLLLFLDDLIPSLFGKPLLTR